MCVCVCVCSSKRENLILSVGIPSKMVIIFLFILKFLEVGRPFITCFKGHVGC